MQIYFLFFKEQKYLFDMELDIDFLISFFKKHTKVGKEEIIEQDAETSAPAPAGGGTTSTSGRAPKKWESGRKFGATYMNDPKHKWTSGRTMGKTYMGDPKYKWESGRQMGKTGGSDYA
jgi:hypothetical protein